MTRISLKEAYDNRDVIAQLVSLRDDVDELLNILKDIDPSGDLTNVVTKTGDQTIDGVKTFIGKIVADCDIIQNGDSYETHAEQLYTQNDYIVTRDGALGGLQPGEFSGFRVNKYDSVHDGHLVMDMYGVARVGDVNDEQPLATRDESEDMASGALVKWDGANSKLIAPSSNVGSDSKPIKIVNGVPTEVANSLLTKTTDKFEQQIVMSGSGVITDCGNLIDQPANSTVMMMIRMETSDICQSLVIGVKIDGATPIWLMSGGQSVAADLRITAPYIRTSPVGHTIQPVIFHSESITTKLIIETVILS